MGALTIPEMENPFSPKEKEDEQWAVEENLPAFGGGDVYNNSFSELLSFDYAGASWPAATVNHGFYSPMDFVDQNAGLFSVAAETETFIAEEVGEWVARDRVLNEKMLRALSLVKESSSGGILAQVWVPMKHGDQLVLSTSEQPYLLDQTLAGYREVSRGYTFSAEGRDGSVLGLPGRVFASRAPEWTSNVGYYHKHEYVRVEHAFSHHVRGSIALPVFQPYPQPSCCAVLELVTTREKTNFNEEIDIVCNALQAVNLATTPPPKLVTQYLSDNHKNAVTEIVDVLRVVCHAHRLPLALTWVPCYAGGDVNEHTRLLCKTNPKERCVLCIEQTACYVNDRLMQGFAHACMEHHLQEGKGLAGKALQSNIPFFFPDVKTYDITEYPLVHHARKFGLSAAVAIRLRSTYTGDNDYVLEFFLPLNVKGAEEQQLLLNNLSVTMQRICKSLRTVSDLELAGVASSDDVPKRPVANLGSASGETSQMEFSNGDLNVSNDKTGELQAADCVRQKASGSRRRNEKKRSIAEKNVSLSVLQQYFSGSLKDAAKSIGVCPTTLKRICRQHGISRWPSRKINKVNRSLRKIKTVLDSVQGVEAGLKFDPSTGGLVATGSVPQETDPNKKSLFHNSDPIPTIKFEEDVYCTTASLVVNTSSYDVKDSNIINMTDVGSKPFNYETIPSYSLDERRPPLDHSKSQSSGSHEAVNEDLVQQNQPSCSSMTDSSNGGGSMLHVSSSSSQSFEEHKSSVKMKTNDAKLVVKATFKDDTVRFKLDMSQPSCLQLYEEVGKRFKLQTGTFQLKYLDDEEEWVMLVSDMDLQECLEVLDDVGTTTVKFQVRDMPCNVGSSGSSNCYLPTG